jgi:tRNA dimethylallyltransferase
MAVEPKYGPPSSISHPRSFLLAGPTAVGKSEIALLLAERLGGEIISVDSMQVYRGMDLGTAKASPGDRARVPHHLIDVVDLTESFDAAQFLQLARCAVADVQARERVPILCGGTGLYFKVFLEGLGQAPRADATLRAKLQATPLPDLLRELAESDPVTYARIDRQNPRRVVRALEVIRLTGQPFSAQRADWNHASRITHHASLCIGLARTPADLQRRIDARVDAMFRHGWVAETEQLLRRGLAQNQTAMQALGYRQIVEHLRGQRSLAETIALVKIRTRQFAKRQMTWFRRQLWLTWIHLEVQSSPEAVVKAIAAHCASSQPPLLSRLPGG